MSSYKTILHTTHSHTPDKPKLRLIVVPASAIAPDEYEKAVLRLASYIGVKFDRVSLNPNQIFYLPSCLPGTRSEHFSRANPNGVELDLAALPEMKVNAARKVDRTQSSSERDEKNLYALANDVVETLFPDGLLYVGEIFSEYRDGRWQKLSLWSLRQRLTRRDSPYFDVLRSPGITNNLIEALKACTSRVEFPDPKPLTLCLRNCVLDIAMGGTTSHAPEFWHRNLLDITHHEDNDCPLWKRFLDETFANDGDADQKKLFLQEFMGYLLVPSTEAQTMLWMIGSGANGKSVVIEIMQALLGRGNYSTVPLDGLGKDFKNAALQGKLANFCPEISGSRRIDEAAIKSIVGGDEIYAEHKGKDGFSFRAYARIVAAGNALPDVGDTSHGFFRRLTVLRFNRQLSVEQMDRQLPDKLRAELGGILVWALAGLRRFRDNGRFTEVPSSQEIVTSYKQQSNPVEVFVAECTKSAPGGKTGTAEVYARYKAFCQDGGYQPLANNKFGVAMSELGYRSRKSNGKPFYPISLQSIPPAHGMRRVALQDFEVED